MRLFLAGWVQIRQSLSGRTGAFWDRRATQSADHFSQAAIQANDPDEIVKFVLSHPRGAESASVQEKIQMLKILNENGANCIAENQQAAFIILKNEENHPASLAQIADGVGPQRIEKNIRGWTNADLKRIAAKGIGSSKSRGL